MYKFEENGFLCVKIKNDKNFWVLYFKFYVLYLFKEIELVKVFVDLLNLIEFFNFKVVDNYNNDKVGDYNEWLKYVCLNNGFEIFLEI